MSTETFLLIALIILVLGALPTWPYSGTWGYTPTGVLVVVAAVFMVWAVAADRPLFRRTSIKTTVQDVGENLREAGREVSDSIRRTVE